MWHPFSWTEAIAVYDRCLGHHAIDWKTQESRMTKKCRAGLCIPVLTRHFFVIQPPCRVRSLLTISVMTFQTRLECTVAFIIHNRIWTFWLLETLAESLSWSFRYGKPTRTPGALYPRLRNLMNTFIYTSLSDLFLIQSLE